MGQNKRRKHSKRRKNDYRKQRQQRRNEKFLKGGAQIDQAEGIWCKPCNNTTTQDKAEHQHSPKKKNKVSAIADTGASGSFFAPAKETQKVIKNIKTSENKTKIIFPNKTSAISTKEGNLPIKKLSEPATKALLVKDLKSGNIVSIGNFCDDGCTAIFCKHAVKIMKESEIILEGKRNKTTRLWDI